MNLPTFIVLTIVIVILASIVYYMYRKHKQGSG